MDVARGKVTSEACRFGIRHQHEPFMASIEIHLSQTNAQGNDGVGVSSPVLPPGSSERSVSFFVELVLVSLIERKGDSKLDMDQVSGKQQ